MLIKKVVANLMLYKLTFLEAGNCSETLLLLRCSKVHFFALLFGVGLRTFLSEYRVKLLNISQPKIIELICLFPSLEQGFNTVRKFTKILENSLPK